MLFIQPSVYENASIILDQAKVYFYPLTVAQVYMHLPQFLPEDAWFNIFQSHSIVSPSHLSHLLLNLC